MITEQLRIEILEETDKISSFIKNWIEDNPHNGNMNEYNNKFQSDFKSFFETANFKHETADFWLS